MKDINLTARGALVALLIALCASACGPRDTASQTSATGSGQSSQTDSNGLIDLGDDPFGAETSEGTMSKGSVINASTASGRSSTGSGSGTSGDYIQRAAARMPKVKLTDMEITHLSHAKVEVPPLLKAAYPNIKVNYIQVNADLLLSRYVTMYNAGDPPDIAWMGAAPQLIMRKYIQNWDDYVNLNDSMWKDIKSSWDVWKMGGKRYQAVSGTYYNSIYLYNRKIFKANGLTEPIELFKQGKWTWTEMESAMKKLTKDQNNDGKPEQYGLALAGAWEFLFATGTDITQFNNGRMKNMIQSAQMTRAMEFYIKLNQENKLYANADVKEAFQRGEIAMMSTQKWVANTMYEKFHTGDFMFVPPPKDPKADAHYVPEEFRGYIMPMQTDTVKTNVLGAVAYLNAMRFQSYDEEYLTAELEKTIQNKESLTREAYDLERLIVKIVKPVTVTWAGLNINNSVNEINSRSLGGESWSKIAAEISPKIDAAIKTYETNTNLQ